MKYLLEYWNKLARVIKGNLVVLFLDYDGTLTPIVNDPLKANLSETLREVLKELSFNKKVKVVIVSGRSLGDLKKRIGLSKLFYIGNHGFEMASINKCLEKKELKKIMEFKKNIGIVNNILTHNLECFHGVYIEDKKVILSVHYRNVAVQQQIVLKKTVYELLHNFVLDKIIQIREGKKVLEISPSFVWNKGKAVRCLIRSCKDWEKKGIFICLGDDKTDEDMFKELNQRGLTVSVGYKHKSYAQYYLKDTQQVYEFLTGINNLKQEYL